MRLVGRSGQPPVRIPLLCLRCTRGDHSRAHTSIGCILPVMLPPYDWVCQCDVPRVLKVHGLEEQDAVA